MRSTSRERLMKTLDHKDPGKVVVDLGSSLVTGTVSYTHLDVYKRQIYSFVNGWNGKGSRSYRKRIRRSSHI